MNEAFATLNVLKVFGLGSLSFFIALLFVPPLTKILYRYEFWKKRDSKEALFGGEATVFNSLKKEGRKVPLMGGLLIWGSALFVILLFRFLSQYPDGTVLAKLDFLSRSQTWLPLFTLVAASIIGFFDDLFTVQGSHLIFAKGLDFKKRILLVTVIGLIGAWWFFTKLEISSVWVPWLGAVDLGFGFIVFFVAVMLATFASGVIDGIDGLAAGVLAAAFSAYSGIAFFQNQIDLAAFCAVIVGALLAFLWFNIPPARFFMGETGMLGLTTTLTVVAFLTDAVITLPLIAFPLALTTASDILQGIWRRFLGRKLFLVAPIHHHFEAKGLLSHTVTMRFWVVSVVSAVIGMVVTLMGK
jgi:phospho-N-acetylmuramoyl-pentapeptide-transferase